MREIYDLGKGRSVRQKTVSVDNVIPDKSIQERHLSDERSRQSLQLPTFLLMLLLKLE